jgi:hypothetical protein
MARQGDRDSAGGDVLRMSLERMAAELQPTLAA